MRVPILTCITGSFLQRENYVETKFNQIKLQVRGSGWRFDKWVVFVLKYKTQGFSALIVQTLNIASEGQPRLSLSQLKFLTKYVTIFWHNFDADVLDLLKIEQIIWAPRTNLIVKLSTDRQTIKTEVALSAKHKTKARLTSLLI